MGATQGPELDTGARDGTSAGVRCSGDSTCSIVVSPGDTTLVVTAVTTDIGFYTLNVRDRPR